MSAFAKIICSTAQRQRIGGEPAPHLMRGVTREAPRDGGGRFPAVRNLFARLAPYFALYPAPQFQVGDDVILADGRKGYILGREFDAMLPTVKEYRVRIPGVTVVAPPGSISPA